MFGERAKVRDTFFFLFFRPNQDLWRLNKNENIYSEKYAAYANVVKSQHIRSLDKFNEQMKLKTGTNT
ncbi:hypothetical protein DERF_001826 [Dermatophagoides farinae]|uniref:Uncharacterized protein n=1 Tax=Dermatophagoides farinae TaxID=6954 RepID=A0A922IBL6_DERFA|nr:hypothetical protein DERF_001826 [Dermatophagoides farinae]